MTPFYTEKMKALSVHQPWAWLIVNGYKPIENRDWHTNRRGQILIHASQKFDRDGYDWIRYEFPHIPMPEIGAFERGGIVGQATIVDCVTASDSPWFFGRFGFLLAGAKSLPFQPCKGKLGFFDHLIEKEQENG